MISCLASILLAAEYFDIMCCSGLIMVLLIAVAPVLIELLD